MYLHINISNLEYDRLLNRLNAEVREAYQTFIKLKTGNTPDTAPVWLSLYQLAITSSQVAINERLRVSELALLLRHDNIQQSGTYAVIYAHCISVLLLSLNNKSEKMPEI